MSDKQMLEILEALLDKESPDQLKLGLFSSDLTFSEDNCGQLLLFA